MAAVPGLLPPRCPLCDGELSLGGGPGAPDELAGWPLAYCSACAHCCCPPAFDSPVDYDALYQNEYLEQMEYLDNPLRHPELALFSPYLAFFRQLGPPAGRSLLDIGCGAGRFLIAARGLGWAGCGLEPAERAVKAAVGQGLRVSSDTVAQVQASGARYDVVCLFDVAEHMTDPLALVSAAMRLIAPGGSLFISVPNWDSPKMREATRVEWTPPVHLQFFSLGSLKLYVEAAALAQGRQITSLRCGPLLTELRPPLCIHWQVGRRWFVPQLWRWLRRRIRGRSRHALQLWLHARVE